MLRPEYVFLTLGIVFGLLFLACTPPFQVPDERKHFLRAYQVSEGQLVPVKAESATGGYLPVAIGDAAWTFAKLPSHPNNKTSWREILAASRVRVDNSERAFVPFPNTAVYSPVAYTPQVLGILLGRLLGLSVLGILYLSRLSALVFWLAAVFLAVRTTPIGKWAFVAVSLLPMTVFLAPSISADSFLYAVVALSVACALKYSMLDVDLSTGQVWSIVTLSIALACLKAPYSLLFLVFLLVPISKFRSNRNHLVILSCGLFLCVFLILSWTYLAQSTYSPARVTMPPVSPALQLHNMQSHPMTFLAALGHTYLYLPNLLGIAETTAGRLGWLDVRLPGFILVLAYVALIWSFALIESRLSALGPAFKAIQVGLVALVFFMINVLIYLSWNPVGARIIEGIQGRYFLPLLVAAIPIASMRRRFVFKIGQNTGLYLGAIQLVVLAVSAATIYSRYFRT